MFANASNGSRTVFLTVATLALSISPVANADDIAESPYERAARMCSERDEADISACADKLVAKWNSPEHAAMIAEAHRSAAQILKVCKGDGEAFSRCAKKANSAKSIEARELALANATLGMFERGFAADERDRAATLARCKKAGHAAGAAWIGMTADEVRVCGWGNPDSINRTITRHVASEQWVYPDHAYLYLDNNRVTAIQD